MTRLRSVKKVGNALVALGLVLAAQFPAAAQASAPPQFGFALGAPGSSPYFRLATRPGRTVRTTLIVVNRLHTPETVELGPADVTTASIGGLAYGPRLSGKRSGWLRLSQHRLRLPGDKSVDVPFAVRVPLNATAGEHYLSIVAVPGHAPANRSAHGRISLRIVTRLAMTVEVSLPGRRTQGLRVGDAGLLDQPAGAFLTLHISSLGNTLIQSTTGTAAVHSGSHELFRSQIDLGPFVPHTAISLHIPWRARLRPGRYVISGVLHPDSQRRLRFRRTFTIGSRTASTAASLAPTVGRAGPEAEPPASATALELGMGALGLLLCAVTLTWLRDRRRNQTGTPPTP